MMDVGPLVIRSPTSTLDPDPDQRQVLDHGAGALLVTGPAGSGKTALLRERFARLVEAGTAPDRVALFVLGRRAAREARDHLVRRLARSLPELPVFTAHGFAFRVVGRRFDDLGYPEPPQVLSAPEQYAVVRKMLRDERPEDWPRLGHLRHVVGFAQQVADFVLRAQERLLDPDDLDAMVERTGHEEHQGVAGFYRRYLEALRGQGRIDFAGLLHRTVRLLEQDLSEAEAFDHVLVDDYQDATFATEGVIRALGRATTSLVVAADPAGHVFSYRGGSLEPLQRLGQTLGGLRTLELGTSHRLGPAAAALAPLGDPSAPDAAAPEAMEARAFAHPGEEADAAAHALLKWRVDEDVPWDGMAVIVRRYGGYLTALRHALARHRVPFVVVAEAAAVASEPANRPMIDLFRYTFREPQRPQLLERLLLSPVVGIDPHALRQLRRRARMANQTLQELVDGDEEELPEPTIEPVRRFRRLVRELPDVAAADGPDGAFFWLWTEVPHFARLVEDGAPQRDLDALSALGEVLAGFAERRPGATVEDYLDTLDAAEFGPDPWTPPEERHPHAVRVVSAHRAHGMQFEAAVVMGCLEGEFPSLGHGEPVVDLERLVDPATTPTERLRRRLAEERALFRLAVSRARRHTLLTASRSTSGRDPRTPSRFAARLGLTWAPPADDDSPGGSLRSMEASLRRRLCDAAHPRAERLAAMSALFAADAEPVAWWGGRDWTEPDTPLHGEEIRTSYSKLSALENCALQYLYQAEMGLDVERTHSLWLGSLIHDIIDRVQRGDLPKEAPAMLAALEEEWRPEAFPNRAIERQRRQDAERMIGQWLADESTGQVVASEAQFEFPVDGAVVRGRVDAIFRVGERGTRVVDYKTSRNAVSQDEAQDSLQLGAYYLAMKRVEELRALGDPEILEFAFLFPPGPAGGYTHRPFKPGRIPDYEAGVEATIRGMIDLVRAERFAPSPEAECRFCRFKPICPLWPEGAEVPL
jgi:superfamily I DNA/RNA helicase/RecB family exonuclease